MAMGTTGTVNITPEMISNALRAVEADETTAKSLHSKLEGTVNELIPGNFSGNAAKGFRTFFDDNIAKLTNADEKEAGIAKIIELLRGIINGISDAIPKEAEGLDDQLADQNTKVMGGN